MNRCYNCTKEFEDSNLTKEHIPPRCFSDVYPGEFKKNRITVLCCHDCNQKFSKIDDELRDTIAIIKDGKDGNKKFLEKGVKSVIRRKIYGKDYVFDSGEGQYKINFKAEPIEDLFMKCHKGMFYYKFGIPIDMDYVSQVSQKLYNEKHNTTLNQTFENYHIQNPGSFIISGHQDIFKASILAYKETGEDQFEITENIEGAFAISSYMVFHDEIDCLVLAIKKDSAYYKLIEPALDKNAH